MKTVPLQLLKQVVLLSLVLLTSLTVHAAFKASCLDGEGRFRSCRIDFKGDAVEIRYSLQKFRRNNLNIPREKIALLTGGDYATEKFISGKLFFLGPLAPLADLFVKKDWAQFGIEYETAPPQKGAILVRVKKKYAMGFETQLEAISNKKVSYGD